MHLEANIRLIVNGWEWIVGVLPPTLGRPLIEWRTWLQKELAFYWGMGPRSTYGKTCGSHGCLTSLLPQRMLVLLIDVWLRLVWLIKPQVAGTLRCWVNCSRINQLMSLKEFPSPLDLDLINLCGLLIPKVLSQWSQPSRLTKVMLIQSYLGLFRVSFGN